MIDPELQLKLNIMDGKLDRIMRATLPEPKTISNATTEELISMYEEAEPEWVLVHPVYGAYTAKSLEEELNRRVRKTLEP